MAKWRRGSAATGTAMDCVRAVLTKAVSVSVHRGDGGPGTRADVERLYDVERTQSVATTDDVDATTDHSHGELQPTPWQAGHRRPAV